MLPQLSVLLSLFFFFCLASSPNSRHFTFHYTSRLKNLRRRKKFIFDPPPNDATGSEGVSGEGRPAIEETQESKLG